MRRLISIMALALMVVGLAGCGAKNNDLQTNSSEKITENNSSSTEEIKETEDASEEITTEEEITSEEEITTEEATTEEETETSQPELNLSDEFRGLLRSLATAPECVNDMIAGDNRTFAKFYGVDEDENGWSSFAVYNVPGAYQVSVGWDDYDCYIQYISFKDIENDAYAIIGKNVSMSDVGRIVDYNGQKCFKVTIPPTGAIPNYSGYYIHDIYNTEYTGDNTWKIEFSLYYKADAFEDLDGYVPAVDEYCCGNTFYIQAKADSRYGYIIIGYESTHNI